MRAKNTWVRTLLQCAALVAVGFETAQAADPEWAGAPKDPAIALGRRLFLREWVPDDPRARGGDGLGPVFNERSCVACHGLGGPGGAGTNGVNVELLTAIALGVKKGETPDRSSLATVHPGLAESGSIVLHRFGLSPAFQPWREHAIAFKSSGQPDDDPPPPTFRMVVSRRNSPALFGAGRIDAIPDKAIEAEAQRQGAKKGRVNRLKNGAIGRFGWKAQVQGLEEFVLTACANELGLEVPGHHQAGDPLGYGERTTPGLDMSEEDCQALVAYIRRFPVPVEKPREFAPAGRIVFDRIGCADCHRPSLGGVDGVYSDLLLHDLGSQLSDDGMYYGSNEETSPGAPKPQEWRTPPLWGLVGTGPYLHDGRAQTISAAIEAHGGQAESSAIRFKNLSKTHKIELLSFLRSLTIPPTSQVGPARLTRRERILEGAEASAGVSQ